MQSNIPALSSAGCGVGDVLVMIRPGHLISPPLHAPEKVLAGAAAVHHLPDGGHQLEFPALPFLGGPVLPGGEFASLFLVPWQHGQAMGGADLITQGPQALQCLGGLAQLQARFPAHRVDEKVRVEVVRVTVRGHQHFKAGPSLLGKLQADGVNLLGRDLLLRREGLDVLVKIHAGGLVIGVLGGEKLLEGIVPQTVNPGDKPLPGGWVLHLFRLAAVVHDALHGTQGLLLFRDVDHRCHGLFRAMEHSSR